MTALTRVFIGKRMTAVLGQNKWPYFRGGRKEGFHWAEKITTVKFATHALSKRMPV